MPVSLYVVRVSVLAIFNQSTLSGAPFLRHSQSRPPFEIPRLWALGSCELATPENFQLPRVTEAGYKSRLKARCRLLVDNLQPPVLKAQISRLIDLERRDCKSDDVALFDLILKHAIVQQRFHRMSQDHVARGDSKSAKPDQKPQRPAPSAASTSSPRRTSQPARTQKQARPPPHDGCLVCKGPHWLKDCPNATDV
ncbi:unnamed protein product [Phytophthora fragariaefolia]|uniref:Unnamed protein product n=1 Tax=Phytophthora fragariaefolia TaxID=1490495 RepID=A0A9W6TRI1_9STRA|nr:unnamed protein product [Phytophthora fragariaefolia]